MGYGYAAIERGQVCGLGGQLQVQLLMGGIDRTLSALHQSVAIAKTTPCPLFIRTIQYGGTT